MMRALSNVRSFVQKAILFGGDHLILKKKVTEISGQPHANTGVNLVLIPRAINSGDLSFNTKTWHKAYL